MKDEIRSYGPGKFSTIVDSYVYDVSMEGGCDEEVSEESAGHWYGLMRHGHAIFKDHDPFLEPLNEAEQNLITESAGVILFEDSCGFVTVDYFETEEELNAEWARICGEIDEEESEDSE